MVAEESDFVDWPILIGPSSRVSVHLPAVQLIYDAEESILRPRQVFQRP